MDATSGGKHMRRHDIRHTAAATTLAALCVLGTASACGGDDEGSASPTSATRGETTVTTTAASPISTAALGAAPITLVAPAEGATVARSFVVRGSGVAFEGTVLWKLTDSGGGEAISGYASAGSTEKQPFQFTVEAPSGGEFTLTVYRESAADGAQTDAVSRKIRVE
ncbi:Gmad2 immunoglobulin-like domain-containing protein [Cryptosporangium aurantiacum]|uniref:Immunoglobulin-like domain of spore germination n=1 Tax=Cryptosporangium aurantiacum TaxID=134849 RepID=A0A1M7QVQ9_9ACTN|nr:Gmad2 immunoglobulin-like domain-containing protein [Cryptosporangium aurantiacum]SHN35658.1 Immunoglobulin-like domain of spore germination [Cryptosporangium aurantiacum]